MEIIKQVKDVKVDDWLDLQADLFADPSRRDSDYDNDYFYVTAIVNLTDTKVLVYVTCCSDPKLTREFIVPKDHYVRTIQLSEANKQASSTR